MIKFLNWAGSPRYWQASAVLVGTYLSIAALGKTADWYFTASMAFGFCLCWAFSRKATLAIEKLLKERNT
jgi:hypothetical protein